MAKADDNPGPDGASPVKTAGTPPAATKPKGGQSATPNPSQDGSVTLSKEDYANLVAARDKNFSAKQELESRVDFLEETQAKNAYIKDIKKKYPDVPRKMLEAADSPESVEAIAKSYTKSVKKAQQDAVAKAQVVETEPDLTPEDAQVQLAKLEKSDDPQKFEKMVDIQSRIKK